MRWTSVWERTVTELRAQPWQCEVYTHGFDSLGVSVPQMDKET